jgi:hypothetical protein
MSSRHEKEKRLRPKNNPYKRDNFVQADYLRISKPIIERKEENLKEEQTEENFAEDYEENE